MRGIPAAVVERALPFVTVFSNMRTVNVLDAAPQVVAALPGMSPGLLQQVLRDRADPNVDSRALVGLAGAANATVEGSKAYRLTVVVEAPSHRRSLGRDRDPASRQRRRAVSCIVVAQRHRRLRRKAPVR
ncbi:hypothetical protein ACVOMS_13555 [Bradyrhizobium guangxiense]